MKRKERYIGSLDEVTITRDGDYAWIAYKEEGIRATHLQIGPEIAEMSNKDILELHKVRGEKSERFLCGPRQAALCEHGLRNSIPTRDFAQRQPSPMLAARPCLY